MRYFTASFIQVDGRRKLTPLLLAAVLFTLLLPRAAFAWVYPEHRDIMVLAIQQLDPERRAVLDALWAEARIGYEQRLCVAVADATQAEKPTCLDYAAWPAISGDHSCSPRDMLDTVLHSDWILAVADVTARLKRKLAEAAGHPYLRTNALRDSDIKLQRTDPAYATRAGSNNVHFLLARESADMTPAEYGDACLSEGSPLNGLGTYSFFHYSALERAALLHRGAVRAEDRPALIRAMLADEAFSVHFLEDVFASGHVAGTWGSAAQRKGTHDYYNEHGIEAHSWNGETMVLTGDAWMRAEDAERAAAIVRTSLEQLVDAARGLGVTADMHLHIEDTLQAHGFDVCASTVMTDREVEDIIRPQIRAVLVHTPVPGLGAGLGELPRFQSELGGFIGFTAAARAATFNGGFAQSQKQAGGLGSLELGVRIGVGLEGVLNEAGDGLVFLDVSFRQDAASSIKLTDDPSFNEFGTITAAIPQRSTLAARLRLPFWLIPGDLLVAAPILGLAAPETFASMAVVAGNGGLLPWQSGIATPIGRIQFMLGREVGISFYGLFQQKDRFLVPMQGREDARLALVGLSTVQFDFPILEYRPFRSFSVDQSSSLMLQLYGGFEIPTSIEMVLPEGAPNPELETIWMGGLRMVFDWRHYF